MDKDTILSDSPTARAAQIQTLQDMLRDVEADEVFQAISRQAVSGPSIGRLSSVDSVAGGRKSSSGSLGLKLDPRGGIPLLPQSPKRKTSVFTVDVHSQDNPAFDFGQRRGSNLMRRSLRSVGQQHPVSLWPARLRSDSRFLVSPVLGDSFNPRRITRRVSMFPSTQLPSTEESEVNNL